MIPESVKFKNDNNEWVDVSILIERDGKWFPILGGAVDVDSEFVPDSGPLRSVATNLSAISGFGLKPGSEGTATATKHLLYSNSSEVTLVWLVRNNSKVVWDQEGTIRVWVLSDSNPIARVTFGGADSAKLTVDPHADLYSDPVPGTWRYGEMLTVIVHVEGAGAGSVPSGQEGTMYDDLGVANVPHTSAANPSIYHGQSNVAAKPSLILANTGELERGSWLIIGDSIIHFQSNPYTRMAFMNRALPATINALGGESGRGVTNPSVFDLRVATEAEYVDSVFCEYGRNDWLGPAGSTLEEKVETVKSGLHTLWKMCRDAGIKRVAQITTTPRVISSDGFATLEGQTMDDHGRIAVNKWLRDGAPEINGVPAETGTTDARAVRTSVVHLDGTVVKGDPSHTMGDRGFVTDATSIIEHGTDTGLVRVDKGRMLSDQVHITREAHDLIAPVLERDLALMGF